MSEPTLMSLAEDYIGLIGTQRHANGDAHKDTEFGENGTEFVLDPNTYNTEYMMLRATIVGFGYKISNMAKDKNGYIIVNTSYPWEKMLDIETRKEHDHLEK